MGGNVKLQTATPFRVNKFFLNYYQPTENEKMQFLFLNYYIMLKIRFLQKQIFLISLILVIHNPQWLSAQTPPTVFPIKVSANGRYLIDQRENPFFYLADTGWQIFNKLTKTEAEQYLEDRKKKGFNAYLRCGLVTMNRDGIIL